MLRVVCASANPHKVAEISDLMSGVVDLQPRPTELADVVEDADTLVGNARLKAVAFVVLLLCRRLLTIRVSKSML